MGKRTQTSQSAFEFMSTYAWALLILAILLISLYTFVSLPQSSIPQTCSFINAITCEGISVNTNSMASAVNLYLVNGQDYSLMGNSKATASINSYGTASAVCYPANVVEGGIILCSITMPKPIPVGSSINGRLLINATICPSQNLLGICPAVQQLSYSGSFSTAVAGSLSSTNQIPVTISISESPTSVATSSHSTVVLTAHVSIFGKPANGAGVTFSVVSDTSAGTSNTISSVFVPTGPGGQATTNLYITSSSSPGTITVSASFVGAPATNTIFVTS